MWKYTKRPDGRISVTIDSNVWNFLFDHQIDLVYELPTERFALFIPREVEIEHLAIPADSKEELRAFVRRTIEICAVRTTYVFGFNGSSEPQRHSGFGVGTFQSQTEREFYAAIRERFLLGRPQTGSRLSRHEADGAVAVQSFFSMVLTCEDRKKVGPLRYAAEHGGQVLFLSDLPASGLSLRAFVTAAYDRIESE